MGDDGVGIHVLRHLRESTPPQADVEFKELSVGGIKLVEEILDYKTVFIIDSIESTAPGGTVNEFSPEQFNNTYHEASPHDMNFITALQLYKKLQRDRIPERIRIFTIGIQQQWIFNDQLTPPIQAAASHLSDSLTKEIEELTKKTSKPAR